MATEKAEADNERIVTFNNSKGLIYFDPDNVNLVRPAAKKVPATYDVDWASDSSACLSASARN
ncbi:MAG: hypothetical protein AAF067_04330 [Pseudomonadota bacterium]